MGLAAIPDDHLSRRGNRGVVGLVLLFVGVAWLLGGLGWVHLAVRTLLAVLLMCIGAGLLLSWRSGGSRWPILLGAVVTVCLIGTSASGASYGSDVGSQHYRPTYVRQLPAAYKVGAGNLRLDLTALQLPASSRPVTVVASVGVGRLNVLVPKAIGLEVQVNDGVGAVSLPGADRLGGLGVHTTWRSRDYAKASRQLVLKLDVGAGQVAVNQAGRG